MTQYNTLNVKLSDLQLSYLKSFLKNGSWISGISVIPGLPVNTGTAVTLNLSSNVVDDSNGETNFPHRLLLTNTRVSRLRKTFANNSSANIKLSKTQLHKMGQSGEFLGRFQRPLLKTDFPLMKNVLKTLAKSVLIPLGLTAAASATDAAIQRKRLDRVWQHK